MVYSSKIYQFSLGGPVLKILSFLMLLVSFQSFVVAGDFQPDPYGFFRCEANRMPLVTVSDLDEVRLNQSEQENVNCDLTASKIVCKFGETRMFSDFQHVIEMDIKNAKLILDLKKKPQRFLIPARLNGKQHVCHQWIQ